MSAAEVERLTAKLTDVITPLMPEHGMFAIVVFDRRAPQSMVCASSAAPQIIVLSFRACATRIETVLQKGLS